MSLIKLYIILSFSIFCNIGSRAQCVQKGITFEYQGKEEKTPLGGVNINAGGATTKSNGNGFFTLEFKNLKIGWPVHSNPQNCAFRNGYILFNIDAIKQWCVTDRNTFFSIIMCKKDKFDALVHAYYNTSNKSLLSQKDKDRKRIEALKKEGRIRQAEYEQKLKAIEDQYNEAKTLLLEKAELVARIDESEIDGNFSEVLKLAREGYLDEAVLLLRQDTTTLELLKKSNKKIEYNKEQVKFHSEKVEEAKNERFKLIAKCKDIIKMLQLAGGEDNYNLCSKYWNNIIEADTSNIGNLYEYACFLQQQNDYSLAESYYIKIINNLKNNVKENHFENKTIIYAYNNLTSLYINTYQYELAKKSCTQSLRLIIDLYQKYENVYLDVLAYVIKTYLDLQNNIQEVFCEEEYIQALEISIKACVESDDELSQELCTFYSDIFSSETDQEADKIIESYIDILKKALINTNYEALQNFILNFILVFADTFEKTNEYNVPEDLYSFVLNLSYMNDLSNKELKGIYLSRIANIHSKTNELDKSEKEYQEALDIYKELSSKNPKAFDNGYANALNNIAAIHTMMQKYDLAEKEHSEAVNVRRKLVRNDPENFKYWLAMSLNNLAQVHQITNKLDTAEIEYNEVVDIYSSYLNLSNNKRDLLALCQSLNNRGILYQMQKHYEKSSSDFLHVLSILHDNSLEKDTLIMPSIVITKGNLSFSLIFNKRFKEAEIQAKEALQLDSSQLWIKTNLLTSILLQGRYNDAMTIAMDIAGDSWNNVPLKKLVIDDLDTFEKKGIIPDAYKKDVENMRLYLRKFKERIVNVKQKDISTWSTWHLSKNWVTERTKTLRNVS